VERGSPGVRRYGRKSQKPGQGRQKRCRPGGHGPDAWRGRGVRGVRGSGLCREEQLAVRGSGHILGNPGVSEGLGSHGAERLNRLRAWLHGEGHRGRDHGFRRSHADPS